MKLSFRREVVRMANLGFAVVAAFVVAPLTSQAWVVETAVEFIAEGDFDGDGRLDAIVIDKLTGAARVAFQNANNELAWQSPFASGIANVTGVAVGRVASTSWDSVVVTSPEANRVNRLDPRDVLTGAGVVPVAIFPPGVGPNLVAALDAGGLGNTALDDYFVGTRENPGARRALLRNNGGATSVLDDDALAQELASANVFEIKTGQGKRVGVMSRRAGAGLDNFQIVDLSGGTVVTRLNFAVPLPNTPARPEFVAQRFDSSNSLGQVLFFRPGDTSFVKYQVQEILLNLQLANSNQFNLHGPLQSLQPLPFAAGARLLAFFGPTSTNLTNATIYEFSGSAGMRVVESMTGNFSGALTLGGGHLALLNADGAGRSDSFQILLANGAGYALGAGGTLPRVTRFSGAANALLFDVEPFVNAAARPRQLQQHPDWSTALRIAPTVRVTSQQFLGSSNGLGSASTRDFGAALSGVTTGLVNQYAPSISVFSGRPAVGAVDGEIRIAPPGGRYGDAQSLRLSVNGPGTWDIRYRTTTSQNWLVYTTNFLLFTNATVEFYARRGNDGALTAMGRAVYTFNVPTGELDSDNDGVPDFVEQTRGLNPLGGADSDGDGFSDLEELARGTNPNLAGSVPASSAGLRTAFNRLVAPRPPHPNTGADTRPRSGVALRAFTLGGAFLGDAVTSPFNGSGATNPAALLSNLVPEAGARLLVESTSDHFDIVASPDSRTGRELIGLIAVPPTNRFSVEYTFGNGSLLTETANWIAAASNAVASAVNPTLSSLLTTESALAAALFERHVVRALIARGTNGATNATLFDFRAGDAGRRAITAADLTGLEQYAGPGLPGYSQQTVFGFLDARARQGESLSSLRDFTRELWRISAAHHNTNEGLFTLPYDQLRRVVAGQGLSSSYTAFPSLSINVSAAQTEAVRTLALVPPRPQTNLTLVVAATPVGAPVELQHATSGTPVTLWRYGGAPCTFPPNLQLLPGTRLAVFGHTDLPAAPGTLAVEVITLGLDAVPMPSPGDADGNLLADSWENLFLGEMGADAFGDFDGDGYSNLQEMLDGTAPDDRLGTPGGTAYSLSPPVVELIPAAGQWRFVFSWPGGLMSRFRFGLEESDEAAGPFLESAGTTTISLGGDQHEIRISPTASVNKFYRLTLRLLSPD
ncbi:MAG: hypothetical protein IPK15_23585 [Verrucomicrobia bacterium]|nr:hypothetical protein [Verrucomicrobiota bacterium]